MASIDATVVLGLAGKVNQVFADEDAYQAFPLAPIGLKADSLRAMITDPLSTAGSQAHAQYSLLVNEIPCGPIWQPDGDRLWDVYGDLLTGGLVELLEKPQSPEQKTAYDRAFNMLYQKGADGIPVSSPAVVAYERHRDAYIAASIEYNNRKGEAEMSSDEAVEQAWADDEPALRAAVDDARVAWNGPGNRVTVDAARQVLSEQGTDSPAAVWEGFKKLFNPLMPEIFFRTTVENLSYVPTSYLPSDVTDTAWPRITVTADELKQLAELAPAELRNRLGGSADAGIDMVSFEYSYVTVSRPWFTPQLFASHAWKFKEPGRVLSDGGSPPTGGCTVYVTGLALARNITVQRKSEQADEPPNLVFLPTKMLVTKSIARPYTASDLTARVAIRQAATTDAAITAATPEPSVAAARPRILTEAITAGAVSRLQIAERFTSLRGTAILTRPLPPKPEGSAAPVETTTDPKDVFVLALQCRWLPKSPDPDPALLGGDSGAKSYTVAKGDTLGKIAAKFYGDSGQWRRIYNANRSVIGNKPDVIRPGQELTIP